MPGAMRRHTQVELERRHAAILAEPPEDGERLASAGSGLADSPDGHCVGALIVVEPFRCVLPRRLVRSHVR